MREIRLSITFNDQLNELLDYGEVTFGTRLAEQKKLAVYDAIEGYLVPHPGTRQPDPMLGLRRYPVSRTPFVLLYDFDDAEVRVHFIFHQNASLDDLDPTSAAW
jgi:plasmid stabilization system protein ParE